MRKKDDIIYLAALSSCERFNSLAIQELLRIFDSAEAIWKATKKELEDRGVPDLVVTNLIWWRKEKNPEKLWLEIKKIGLEVIGFDSEKYPQLLREIPDFPIVLYIRGEIDPADACIGIVGNRNISQYGTRMTSRITQKLVDAGMVVVSGLALGVDGAAHKVAVGNQIKTIAVVAHGLDQVYPATHSNLAKEILRYGGALVSEYAPGDQPLKHHFLERNRIIAGLSLGTLVVEAAERSGALTTARCALEYGRSVYAVPGDVERPQAIGTINLIKQGAIPVTSGEDILKDLNISLSISNTQKMENLSGNEQVIMESLASGVMHIDQLAGETGLEIACLSGLLMEMEMKNLVINTGGMKYTRN